jgi:2-dehydro-3-deoxy-D-arabinonate dehydratase
MNICRFKNQRDEIRLGVATDDALLDLAPAGLTSLTALLESEDPVAQLQQAVQRGLPRLAWSEARLLAPVERQEVWAAGVTYLRSKTARMEESDFSATAYDRVYEAERPEIFFKSLAEKVVGQNEPVGIRADANWNVPEPELALVFNSRGRIVGHTIGNDMSSRDIEGENPLYLPQAKFYDHACGLGPSITLADAMPRPDDTTIRLVIERAGNTVFDGSTKVSAMKRTFEELIDWLGKETSFPHGAILLTGTGVVPPDDFTLAAGDVVHIDITGIGRLTNPVRMKASN